MIFIFFFFNDTATTEIYTLSLHDALPIASPWGSGSPRDNSVTSSPGATAACRRRRPNTRPAPGTARTPGLRSYVHPGRGPARTSFAHAHVRQGLRPDRAGAGRRGPLRGPGQPTDEAGSGDERQQDRKSTRLNSSHSQISYAVLCLEKKQYTLDISS